ncbi:NAD(P)-binding protein [Xylariaceae sp. FL1651]|nr:NAD(P)-binding protein [Xylariaceae sp. FL1651]
MSNITKVALAGATGNLGPTILDQLLKAGFQVTALTRQSSNHKFPESVTVKAVDYDSVESLTDALQGQDAVISTLGAMALSKQLHLVEAAVKANVKRFIPSEFGSDTTNPKTAKLPVFADKIVVQEALKKEASKGSITYTIIRTGPFFDWGMEFGLVLNVKEKIATLYDGGERPFSTTTLETIGKAVAGVLKNPEATKNRAVSVHDTAPTMKQLKAVAEKVTGTAWQGKEVSIENDVLPAAWAELKKENPDENKFVIPFICAAIFGEGYGGYFEKVDNEILGLKEMTEAEVEAVVAKATK